MSGREIYECISKGFVGIPPRRKIVFTIKLVSNTKPISSAPYRTVLTKLRELENQLRDIESKGFIQPIISLWGAMILFVKKKDDTSRIP